MHQHIHQASTFTLILLDDCARFVTGHGVDDAERAEMVISTFEEAVARHGKPERVMHDRGSAFWSWRGILAGGGTDVGVTLTALVDRLVCAEHTIDRHIWLKAPADLVAPRAHDRRRGDRGA